MDKVILEEDELQFILHTLVASCEIADPTTKNVKISRLLELFRDLTTCPTNRKAFLDGGAENILLGLVHSDSVLTQQVVSCLSANSNSSSDASSANPAPKPLLPGKYTHKFTVTSYHWLFSGIEEGCGNGVHGI